MIVRTVKTTSKGQLTIPVDILRAMGLQRGDELVLIQEDDRVVLAKAETVAKAYVDDLAGWERISEPSLADVWDNAEDEAWNDV